MKIDSKNAREHEVHQWSTEASDLRLPPGCWPGSISTELGNGQPFIFQTFDGKCAFYRQALGCLTLKIWND